MGIRYYCSFIHFSLASLSSFPSFLSSKAQWRTKCTKSLPSWGFSFSLGRSICTHTYILTAMRWRKRKENRKMEHDGEGTGCSKVTFEQKNFSSERTDMQKPWGNIPLVANDCGCRVGGGIIGHVGSFFNLSFCFEGDGKPQSVWKNDTKLCFLRLSLSTVRIDCEMPRMLVQRPDKRYWW